MVETSIVLQARLESFESIEPSKRKEKSSYNKSNCENRQWLSNQAQTPRSFVEWLEQSWAQWLHHETGRVNFDALSEAHAQFQDQVDVDELGRPEFMVRLKHLQETGAMMFKHRI